VLVASVVGPCGLGLLVSAGVSAQVPIGSWQLAKPFERLPHRATQGSEAIAHLSGTLGRSESPTSAREPRWR
jgi:hypothetical protein